MSTGKGGRRKRMIGIKERVHFQAGGFHNCLYAAGKAPKSLIPNNKLLLLRPSVSPSIPKPWFWKPKFEHAKQKREETQPSGVNLKMDTRIPAFQVYTMKNKARTAYNSDYFAFISKLPDALIKAFINMRALSLIFQHPLLQINT